MFFKDLNLDPDEVQEFADHVGDAVQARLESGGNALEVRWAAEGAVKEGLGVSDDE